MAKFAINKRKGNISIHEFSTAAAQREVTIRLGLEWLAAGGHIQIKNETDEVTLSKGDGVTNSYLQRELYLAVKGLLEETAAYRNYLSHADIESIFKF